MKFYHFRQNNSGGVFNIDDTRGIGVDVWIQAPSVEAAEQKAKSIGVYFDGCNSGLDCNCCGDRWYPLGSEEQGEDWPTAPYEYTWTYHDTVYIHLADGILWRLRKEDGYGV
jgi:hypothetical protein